MQLSTGLRQSMSASALCLFIAGCAAPATKPPPAAVLADRWVDSSVFESGTACHEHLTQADGENAEAQNGFSGRLVLATWNAQKSTRDNWEKDLRALSAAADILLLQEATISPDAIKVLPHPFVAVAEGYRSGAGPTGVLSASHIGPVASCVFISREPLLQTLKASSITRYPLAFRDESLLVVNVHGVNFSLGLGAYQQQLTRLAIALQEHVGPIIFAGDFNTWHGKRSRFVEQLAEGLNLCEIEFSPDSRKTFLGQPLDRIFARGLSLLGTNTVDLGSSDHDAVVAVFAIKQADP